jgi:serine/threonine-protein kinase
LNKAGTGIYVNASPGIPARALRIDNVTPGFTVRIYARTTPPPATWPDSAWIPVSAPTTVRSSTLIPLTGGSTPYRYYLVWITDLGGHEQLVFDELTLYS